MEHCRPERRSGRSTNVCERTDEPSCLPVEVMCRVQREKTWHSGRRGCILSPYQAKMEILAKTCKRRTEAHNLVSAGRMASNRSILDFARRRALLPQPLDVCTNTKSTRTGK